MIDPNFLDLGEDRPSVVACPEAAVWLPVEAAPPGMYFVVKGRDDSTGKSEFIEKAWLDAGESRIWYDWRQNLVEVDRTVTHWMYVPGMIPSTDELLRWHAAIGQDIALALRYRALYLAAPDGSDARKSAWKWFGDAVAVLRRQMAAFFADGNEVPDGMARQVAGIESDFASRFQRSA